MSMLGRQKSNYPRRAALAAATGALLIMGLGASAGVASASDDRSFPGCPLLLESKSNGPCVEKLQNELNAVNPEYKLAVTKTFDAPTRIAVLDFQGRNHFGADGNVGSITADELQKQYDALPTNKPPSRPRPPQEGTAEICSAHKANTATWANCESTDGMAHWARLITTCDIPGIGSNHTTTGKWELVPAGGSHTISGNCRFKAVNATVEWRPY